MDQEKAERLDAYLAERDLDSVWFARPNSFAWLTGGGSNVVDRDADAGVAAVGYDGDGLTVVTDTIEADRLADEEVPEDVPVVASDWYDRDLPAAVRDHADGAAAIDVPAEGFEDVVASPLRHPLTERDLERYRELGATTAAAVESVCRELRPEDTEHEVASALRVALSSRGVAAPVALVGGAERARAYRHYTPTDAELGGYALVSVTAEDGGLYASLTRTVAFDPPSWLSERTQNCARVAATALGATRRVAGEGGAGDAGDAGDVFAAIQSAYDAVGHPDEWERHHQGGATGYAGREWFARPDADAPVTAPTGYAYNPTIQGAKSEDTYLLGADGAVERLTATRNWRTSEVGAVDEDCTIECASILDLRGE